MPQKDLNKKNMFQENQIILLFAADGFAIKLRTIAWKKKKNNRHPTEQNL